MEQNKQNQTETCFQITRTHFGYEGREKRGLSQLDKISALCFYCNDVQMLFYIL